MPQNYRAHCKACASVRTVSHSEHVVQCKEAIEALLSDKRMPMEWVPAYVSMFRAAGGTIQIAANFHLPKYLHNLKKPRGTVRTVDRPTKMRVPLFNARVEFIKEVAPFICDAEDGFNEKMLSNGIEQIDFDNVDQRQKLFDLEFIGTARHQVYPSHLWAHTLHLPTKHDKPSEWDRPCARCELINKSMYSWAPGGFKCVSWRKEFPPLNCAESLAVTLVIKEDLENAVAK